MSSLQLPSPSPIVFTVSFAIFFTVTRRSPVSVTIAIHNETSNFTHNHDTCYFFLLQLPINLDNLCCLNTIVVLIILVVRSNFTGGLAEIVQKLKTRDQVDKNGDESNSARLRRLIYFWGEYYRRGRDVQSLMVATGYLIEWREFSAIVHALCKDDGSETALLKCPLRPALPKSAFVIPRSHLGY